MIENVTLQYCSVCDCILSFNVFKFDRLNKNDILKIKKRIMCLEYIDNEYLISNDIKVINNLLSVYKNHEFNFLLLELLDYFNNLKMITLIS